VIDAIAGEGEGTFPTCTSLGSEIKTIGGVEADDNGNIQLDLQDCVWTEMRLDGSTSSPVNPNTDYLADLGVNAIYLNPIFASASKKNARMMKESSRPEKPTSSSPPIRQINLR